MATLTDKLTALSTASDSTAQDALHMTIAYMPEENLLEMVHDYLRNIPDLSGDNVFLKFGMQIKVNELALIIDILRKEEKDSVIESIDAMLEEYEIFAGADGGEKCNGSGYIYDLLCGNENCTECSVHCKDCGWGEDLKCKGCANCIVTPLRHSLPR